MFAKLLHAYESFLHRTEKNSLEVFTHIVIILYHVISHFYLTNNIRSKS